MRIYICIFMSDVIVYNWPIIHCIAILHNSVAEKGGKIRWGGEIMEIKSYGAPLKSGGAAVL